MKPNPNGKEKRTFQVTAVMIEDPDESGFTGFFEEFPGAVAEGDTEDELMENLFKALRVLGRMNKEDVENNFMPKVSNSFGSVSRRQVEFEYA